MNKPLSPTPPVPGTRRPPKQACSECRAGTRRLHPILAVPLCSACQRSNQEKYRYVTKGRAMGQYRLKLSDLATLGVHEVDNPYYKKAPAMQLYLLSQVEDLARRKWGNTEPYIVQVVPLSTRLLAWLLEDLERVKLLSPAEFEELVADRLTQMGLDVQRVGDVFRKDGGIDLIAYPNRGCAFPFLLAVQAKHHRTTRKTPARDVRDFHAAVAARTSPFHMGMIITNTSFTADARWFASNNQTLLRLRDLADVGRWLHDDFVNEHEWREIPDRVELAPGVYVEVPKRRIWTP